MSSTPVAEYAAAVRDALSDIPEADRAELLEDLEDHLAEIAADHDGPLEDRLGSPEAYAAELRAAYTDAVPAARSASIGALLKRFEERLADTVENRIPDHPAVRTALRDARPMWWVARGYLVAYLGWVWQDGDRTQHTPYGIGQTLLLLVSVALSVWLGQHARRGLPRRTAFRAATGLLGVAGVGAGVVLFGELILGSFDDPDVYYPQSADSAAVPDGIVNLYPYKDGKPLTNVQLFDQDGQPFNNDDTGNYDYSVSTIPGSLPVAGNVYPKPICIDTGDGPALDPEPGRLIPSCTTTTQAGPTDGPTAGPTVSPTTSPSSPPPTKGAPTAKPTASP